MTFNLTACSNPLRSLDDFTGSFVLASAHVLNYFKWRAKSICFASFLIPGSKKLFVGFSVLGEQYAQM